MPSSEKIQLSFDDKAIVIEMMQNSATASLLKLLPLTLTFEDYAGMEKISDLPNALDLSNVPRGFATDAGDLTLYAPWGNLAFFYRERRFTNGLVPLGHIIEGSQHLMSLSESPEAVLEKIR